jgi:hypothetical protein
MPFSLGTVNPAGGVTSTPRVLPGPGQSDWYVVNVPYVTNFRQHGTGSVTVQFAINEASYRFEVHQSCSDAPACSNSSLTQYTYGDNACTGTTDCSTRTSGWPSTLLIRVYNAGAAACGRYQLQVSR